MQSKLQFKITSMKYKKYFILIFLSVLILFSVVLYTIYSNVKQKTIQDMNTGQKILAQQAAAGIKNYMANVISTLNFFSHFPEIIELNTQGKRILMNYQNLNSDEIKGITRINAQGKIIYTVPFKESIGKDISYQEHIRLSLKTHKVVVSDVFAAVQGFRTVAVHVPVFKRSAYDGTIAFLLSFDKIAQKYIENIHVGESGYAWVVSEKGIEISSPFPDHIGKNVYDTYKEFPEIISMVGEMLKGKEGFTVYNYNRIRDTSGEIVFKNAVYMPISFDNTFWSIVIATPEDEVLASLSGFKTNLFLVTIALLMICVICMYLIVRFQVITGEQRKREVVLTALKESEAHYRFLFEQNPMPMLIYELEGLILLAVNDAFVAHYGYSKTEASALHLTDLYPESEKKAITDLIKTLHGHAYVGEWHHLKKDGTQITIEPRSHGFSYEGLAARIAVINDITERKRIEAQLAESEQKYRELVEHANSIILRWTSNGEITFLNEFGQQFFGYSAEEILGRHVVGTIVPTTESGGRELELLMEQICAHPEAFEQNVNENMRRNGERVWIAWTNKIVLDAQGRVSEIFSVGTDITERKQTEEELQKYRKHLEEMVEERTAELVIAKERAESADQLKSAFLATMSHELRTPLNSIIGFTGILIQGLAGPLNNEQTKQLGMVQNSAHHLLALINDVLDISKIEAGQLEVSIKKYDFSQSIEKIISSIQPLMERKGLELQTNISPEVSELVSDSRRVEQILLNLLNNAIKFTEKGSIQIECKIVGKKLITSVIDTGIGIRDEDLEKLFKPFSQIDTGTTRSYEGTGLGLSISKRLVEKLGGNITVQSKRGIGSTFIVTLPIIEG